MDREATVRILFVCHGNICRSPMAQCVMQNLVDEADIGNRFLIDSVATTNEELGNPIYPPARRTLEEHGVAIVPHRARRIQADEWADWDLIVCMDEENMSHLQRILGSEAMGKVHKLMAYAGLDSDVADPWYTSDFEATFDDVMAGCQALLESLVD